MLVPFCSVFLCLGARSNQERGGGRDAEAKESGSRKGHSEEKGRAGKREGVEAHWEARKRRDGRGKEIIIYINRNLILFLLALLNRKVCSWWFSDTIFLFLAVCPCCLCLVPVLLRALQITLCRVIHDILLVPWSGHSQSLQSMIWNNYHLCIYSNYLRKLPLFVFSFCLADNIKCPSGHNINACQYSSASTYSIVCFRRPASLRLFRSVEKSQSVNIYPCLSLMHSSWLRPPCHFRHNWSIVCYLPLVLEALG